MLQANRSSLEDAIQKASSVQAGTVYAAQPTLTNGGPRARVSFATPDGKSVVIDVDLRSGKVEKR